MVSGNGLEGLDSPEQRELGNLLALVEVGAVASTPEGGLLVRENGTGELRPAPGLNRAGRYVRAQGWVVEVERWWGLTDLGRGALGMLRASVMPVEEPELREQLGTMASRHRAWLDSHSAAPVGAQRPERPSDPWGELAPPSRNPSPTSAPMRNGAGSGSHHWQDQPRTPAVGTLVFTPASDGPSWMVEVSRLDRFGLGSALSDAQRHELRELVDRLGRELGEVGYGGVGGGR